MSKAFTYPKVAVQNSVMSSDYHCGDAVLVNIILEKGNPKLRQEFFRAFANRIRQKQEKARHDELHLQQYPFADLANMLKKKRENQ